MKIAILGSDSFLAKQLSSSFQSNGWNVTPFSRTTTDRFSFPDAVPSIVKLTSFDVIVLTASAGVQAGSGVSATDLYGINLFYPVELITQLGEHGFNGIMITFGSYFEIGNCGDDRALNEIDLVHTPYVARNAYSLSKRLLTRFRDSFHESFRWFHVVLPTIYGKGERSARLIPYLIESARLQKDLSVTAGLQVRQYLHTDDVSTFVEMALTNRIPADIYNLAPAGSVTISELRSLTIHLANPGYRGSIEIKTGRDEDMKVLKLDASKANSRGWLPKVSLEAGINSYLA